MMEIGIKIEHKCIKCDFSIAITDVKSDRAISVEVIRQLNAAAVSILSDHYKQAHNALSAPVAKRKKFMGYI